ncbi:class I SAM-dependent methyltransferase [Pectinatus brassicae]|uniref:2-polyprenyl-3-methyl-5-hydroxy-6-metoxy-1, 4-benzoquinol methylase n=1 Tax=Pectinatus brassicae TaxID=862415 RepID=A0A840UM63_9FIRM|nr:class I SAM-dependent methyltransferase [Pectinatus brassicae]MBB5336887.1 2-polyprenyl-3-methyl-5-hydroxy-6-metoxy-1,4-benzoquinol methylase [Pectinatus brassicae]
MKIGKVTLNFDKYFDDKDIYSDGNIENELLTIVKDNKQKEVLDKDNRWPILYHFSEARKNILRWFPFEAKSRILEIGSGCGAITELFCEKNLVVHGIESSKRRAEIAAYRNKKYENLSINVGDFMDVHCNEKYNYITTIGVLEYAPMFIKSENPFDLFLNKCRSLLAVNGTLLIAIENRLGIKYWAGATEDHTGNLFEGIENYQENSHVRTFSKKELEKILWDNGFKNLQWYYPYPDYKFPRQIFSDDFLPTADWLYENIVTYDKDRVAFFNEKKALQSIADSGNFTDFSNSFLVICKQE